MKHVARSALILTIFFGIDKVLALVRQVAIAHSFGLSQQLDAFNAANNLPDMLFALISGGALAIAFIPVLSEYLEKDGRSGAWDLFSRVANLAFLVTAGLAIPVALFAGPIVQHIIAPGFTPEQQALAATLMRLNLAATLVFSLSGLVMAGLQANQHFLLPAMAPALYNLGQIFGALILAPKVGLHIGPLSLPGFGLGIYGLVYGVILGAFLHLGIQIPGLLRYHFHWTPAIGLRTRGVSQVLSLMGPRLVSMLFIQLIFIGRDNFASRLGTGPVTALTYGWFIMQVPETLIGTAIATALLPTISEHFIRFERDIFRQTISRSLQAILALALPAAALLSIVLRPLVQIAFSFDPAGTELVVWVSRAFLLGVIGHSVFEVAARAFYAQQNARTPMLTAALRLAIFLFSATILYKSLGAVGIALADTIAITCEASLLLFLLARQYPGLLRLGWTVPRVLVGVAGSALLAYLIMQFLELPELLLAPGALVVGALVMLPFAWPEMRTLVRM